MQLCGCVWRLLSEMKKTVWKWTILLCLLLACMCASAVAEEIAVHGCAYMDDNANALCDPGETLISGVPISLERFTGDAWEAVVSATTDAYGQYAFEDLSSGEYRLLCQLNDPGFYASAVGTSSQHISGAVVLDGIAAPTEANIALRPAASLAVQAFVDSNADGQRGAYERELSGVLVEVLGGDDVLASGVTDQKGSVLLNTAPGEHALRVTLPDSYAFTTLGEEATAISEPVALTAGSTAAFSIGAYPAGYLSGRAFEDMNNNGVMEDDEPGAADVVVHLSGKRTGIERSLTTDESGEYCFDRLPDDLYTITAELPNGMLYARYSKTGGDRRSIFTGDNLVREFAVKSTAPVADRNIGVVQKGVIYGVAFLDLNYNGLLDEGEAGYAGVTVEAIKLSNNESLGRCVTGEDGSFRLENLRGGDYRLRAILPDDGSIFSQTAEGDADSANLFQQNGSRRESSIQPLSIVSGGEASALIGVARGASVSGTVFQDADYNGCLNGKEKLLSGVKVRAVDENGNVVATSTTGQKGQYLLSGIMPGQYTIQVQRKNDFGFTRLRPAEKGGSFITVLEGDWGTTAPIEIAMAQEITGVNAGMLPSATVSGFFFHDGNDNGLWDGDELGMLNAQVRLLSEDGEIDLVRTPDENGSYFFDGVMPGSYTLTYLLPEHCEMAKLASDGNTVTETVTASFKVAMGEDVQMSLAGAVTLGSFDGFVFNDSNANGVQDAGEAGLSDAFIILSSADVTVKVPSAEDGSFHIAGLRPSDYTLAIQLPYGYIFSRALEAEELLFANRADQTLACSWASLINRTEKAIGAVRPGSIAGEIWMDEDMNAQQSPDEWIMEGLTLTLIDEADGAAVDTIVTAEHGFLFENVRPGSYTVRFSLPEQSTPAGDSAATFRSVGNGMEQKGIVVSEGENVSGLTAGLVSRTSIGGTAWLDENGTRSAVPGVKISLSMDGAVIATAVTDEQGAYRFDGLWPADYTLTAAAAQDAIFARPGDPSYGESASIIADVDTGESRSLHLLMAQHQLDCSILYIKPGKVGDLAWLDENGNGLLDGSERRLAGVSIALMQDDTVVYETVTDAYGYYLFPDVYPGQYVLKATAWPEMDITTPVEKLRIISSCLTSGDGTEAYSDPFTMASGESNMNFDVGFLLKDGCTLPSAAAVEAPGRNWTLLNMPIE